MTSNPKIRVGLVWTQFAPHHIDRAEAAAERLGERAEVIAVEVASNSVIYANWTRPQHCTTARVISLFPGQVFDHIPRWRRVWALLRCLAGFRLVCFGIGYNEYEVLLVTVLLRLAGTRVIMMTDSKFDDRPRSAMFEMLKRVGLSCFSGAIVASARSMDYVRFLGFVRRPVLLGYDTISLERMRSDAAASKMVSPPAYNQRSFIYVGRFVDLKNLPMLIDAYDQYAKQAGPAAHRLVLVGSGPLEAQLRDQVRALGLGELVTFAGFCSGSELAGLLHGGLALLLVSYCEPWGLVVNEALALGLPVIASEAIGARDALVRSLINGVVVENGSASGVAAAMTLLAQDESRWNGMSQASRARAWLGGVAPFADAVELLIDPAAQPAGQNMARYLEQYGQVWGKARR